MSGVETAGLTIAICQAAALAITVARKLCEVKHRVRKFSSQATRLHQQVNVATRLLDKVKIQLEQHEACGTDSHDINVSIQACRTVLGEIEATADLALTLPAERSFWRKFKYVIFSDNQVREYIRELDHCFVLLLGFLLIRGHALAEERSQYIIQLLERLQDVEDVPEYNRRLDIIQTCDAHTDLEGKNLSLRYTLFISNNFSSSTRKPSSSSRGRHALRPATAAIITSHS